MVLALWFDAEGVVFSICKGGGYVLVGAAVEIGAERGFVGERSAGLGGGVVGEKAVEGWLVLLGMLVLLGGRDGEGDC